MDGFLLKINDILNNEDIQEIVIHESIHAILNRTDKECKKYNIVGGTGILERYNKDKLIVELGRGFNEGYTEWLCEKLGYDTLAYPELTDFVRLIEVAIGTEKTMELGKGNIKKRFPDIMGMSNDDLIFLLANCDNLYIIDDILRKFMKLKEVLNHKLWPDTSYLDDEKIESDYQDVILDIEKLIKDSHFLLWCKKNSKDNSEESLYEYINEELIKSYEENRKFTIINCESIIIDKYFSKDFDKLLNENEDISIEDYKKCRKIFSLLNTTTNDIPNDLFQIPTSVRVKQEFEEVSKKYLKKFAKEYADKYKDTGISLRSFLRDIKELCNNNEVYSFIKEFSSNIGDSEFVEIIEETLSTAYDSLKYCDDEVIDKLDDFSIYKIVSQDKDKDLTSTIVSFSNGNFSKFEMMLNNGKVIRSSNDEVIFDFTTDRKFEDEYSLVMENFSKLQRETFEKNPNSKIHIINREIVVQDGNDYSFFYIHNGELIPMYIEKQYNLKFLKEEKEQDNSNLPSIKVSKFLQIVNFIKRKWNGFKNRNKKEPINYIYNEDNNNSESLESISSTSKIDSYRVDGFDEKLAESKKKRRTNIEKESNELDNDRSEH